MATQIIIRNLDPDVVARLSSKAAAAGQSLQAFMAELATNAAVTLSPAELTDRAQKRIRGRAAPGPTRADVLRALAELR